MSSRRRSAQAGFTLVEALIAVVLMGAVLAALATITAQWLPNWNRGFASVQRNHLLELGLERLVADLSAAEYVPPRGGTTHPLFAGTALSVTFVRSALGPNTRPGLEIVRVAETADGQGPLLVRTRARFAPSGRDDDSALPPHFADPVVLLRAPYRVSFSYAGPDRAWKDTWQNAASLPRAVRLILRDAATQQTLAVSTATTIHVDSQAACGGAEKSSDCGRSAANKADPDKNGTRANRDDVTAQVQR